MGFLIFGRKHKEEEPIETSLDSILQHPGEFHETDVILRNLVIDRVIANGNGLMVHQEGGSLKGLVWVYYSDSIRAQLSEPGHKIMVHGRFYDKTKVTYVYDQFHHIEASKVEYPDLAKNGLIV